MARFFIDRPIFAWVIAIIIMLAGGLALFKLPVSMYPNVAPPAVEISATYPGASAKVVEDSVTQIIEQNMKGLDGLIYFSSNSSSNGQATITLTFESGTNPDIAQVQVQNKLQLAMPLLPQEVQRQGINVAKSSSGFLNVIAFVSENGSMDANDIADYVGSNVVDRLSRVPGVGNIQVFGGKYAMRIWLDPNKLHTYGLSVAEVTAAIKAQNAQVAIGQLGGAPSVKGQQLNATINAQSRLQTPEQFRNIIVRGAQDGAELRLGDVARVELGAESYDFVTRYNGQPASGLAVTLATGANALDTAAGVDAALDDMKSFFPAGLKAEIPYDTTPFVRVSIKGVVQTLLEAIVLVFVVMYLFLQNFRATLIPTIAVPVVLLGTFGVLAAFGYSINTLTMFALVLAIGLLVDDAIVVVENVEQVMTFEGLAPKPATLKAMGQITGALVGIVLVLTAVFLPMAFFSGVTGVIYRQFSVTIAAAMILSVLVAMTITPALCGSILHQIPKGGHPHGDHGGEPSLLGKCFIWFNHRFERTSNGLRRRVDGFLGRRTLGVGFYLALSVATGLLLWHLPGAFLPDEDQGMLNALVKLPAGATLEQTRAVMDRLSAAAVKDDGVLSIQATAGFSVTGSGQNVGQAFIRLKDWDDRKDDADTIAARLTAAMASVPDAQVFITSPPAILGLGDAGGFTLELQDEGGAGHAAAVAARNTLLKEAARDPKLVNVRYASLEDAPVYAVKVDDAKAQAMGVNPQDINDTLNAALGGDFVNNFIYKGRIKKVFIQGTAEARMQPQDIERWSVRNQVGQMVPLSSLVSAHWTSAPAALQRYNGVSAMEITGQPAPGVSSGEAMAEIARLADALPEGFSHAWSDMAYQEQLSGNQAPMLYAISLLFVFLCLAALYESWAVPFAVMLAVPVGVFGAVLMMNLRGLNNDVYFQVGLLTTIGLAAKNGILIVEFARILEQQGRSTREAILQAVYLRLRPIVMTSLAFLMGVLPLVFATGAGSAARRSLGTGVAGGTVASMVLGMFFVPLFYLLVRRLFPGRAPAEATAPEASP